jgi:RNA polymerase sigma-70 factor (ECF subfamily)
MDRADIDAVYRAESRQVLATLIRLLGDFDLAEEALNDAFVAAAEQWPRDGAPRNPRAWLVSTGRFKAIDRLRRRVRFDVLAPEFAREIEANAEDEMDMDDSAIPDDRLRLIFTCCHPALAPDGQVALTLREVCGLTTEEIARAFLVPTPTVAQSAPRRRFATHACPTSSRSRWNCRDASMRSCASSISFSTKAIRPPPATL